MSTTTTSILVATMGAAAILAMMLAAPANADPNDDHVFDVLLNRGGFHDPDLARARQQAISVCEGLNEGTTWLHSIMRLERVGYSTDDAISLMVPSVVAYCPDKVPKSEIGQSFLSERVAIEEDLTGR